MAQPNEYRVIANPDFLNEKYIPQNLIGRDAEIERLRSCLNSILSRRKPINVWLYGPPGAGKTAIAKLCLKEVTKTRLAYGVYVNAWEKSSLHAVLDRIIDELKIFGAERPDAGFKMERLRRFLKDSYLLLILDEIDQPCPKEKNAILYNLCILDNVGVVCISNSRTFMFGIDERIRSRLNAAPIEFGKYPDSGILEILKARAGCALQKGSWDDETLEGIASMSHGDARIAIQTLRNAAYCAETEGTGRITDEHARKAWAEARVGKKSYLLKKLTPDHRLLYELIRTREQIVSSILYQLYLLECARAKSRPLAQRTFYEYLQRLEQSGLIRAEGSGAGSRSKTFRVLQ